MTQKITVTYLPIVPAILIGFAMFIVATAVNAQTTTPGVPGTGMGGESVINAILLVSSALAVTLGAIFIRRAALVEKRK